MSYLPALTPLLSMSGSALPVALAEAFVTGTVRGLQAVRRDVQAWRHDIGTITENLRRDAERFRASADVPDWRNLDELIELAEHVERSLAEDHAHIVRLAKKLIEHAATLPPPARRLAEEIAKTAVNVHADHVEALRDARWELMARRAEREPPVAGAKVGDLGAYLNDLLGA